MPPRIPHPPGDRRAGFTLLEVVLAIALSATLLGLLALAVNMYLLRLEMSRSTVEQAQLARGVARMMMDDLRNVAVVYEQDISAAEEAAAGAESFNVEEEVDMSSDELAAQEGGGGGGGGGAGAGGAAGEEMMTAAAPARPYVGLWGNLQQLQVDVNRVRPVFTPDPNSQDGALTMNLASPGITSVRYLLTEEGLARQELNRDRAVWAQRQGDLEAWEATTRIVAPEVVDLRFRYHDGTTALEYWNIEERQGQLPLAVEVRVGIRPAQSEANDDAPPPPVRYYRVTAPIPAPATQQAAGTAGTGTGTGTGMGAGAQTGGAGGAPTFQ